MVNLIEKGWDPKLKDRGGRTAADYARECKVEYTLEGCIKRLAFHCFDKNSDGFIDTPKEMNLNYFPNPAVVTTYDMDRDQRLNRTEYQQLQKDPAYIGKAQLSMCSQSARRSFRLNTCPASASSNAPSSSGDGEINICKEVQDLLGNYSTEVLTPEQINIFLRGNLEALQAMVPSEVSVNAVLTKRGFLGRTDYVPMIMAAINTNKCTDECHAKVQYLLDQGADPNVMTPGSLFPKLIHIASVRNNLKVIRMLEKAGADLNHTTTSGHSVLTSSLIIRRGYKSDLSHIEAVVEYLLSKTNIGITNDPKKNFKGVCMF